MKIVNYIVVIILTLAGVTFDVCALPEPSYFLSIDEKAPGAEKPYEMIHESFQNPLWKNNPVHVFHPQGFVGECPVIFLSHKDGAKEPEKYLSLIRHIVSKGYVGVFSPTRKVLFRNNEIHKYKLLFEAYTAAVSRFSTIIDTTRIGFIGHGFGGGAVPALMLRAIRKSRWGASGAFLFIMSPGYMYSMDQRSLDTYPEIVKLVTQIFTDDKINDPKIAADIFGSIAIPTSNKVFLVVTSDTIGKRHVHADNNTTKTWDTAGPAGNPLGYNGISRVFDELAAYTFNNDTNAKSRIFQQKKSMTFTMGAWNSDVPSRSMIATRDPELFMKDGPYLNSWHGLRNPRVEISVFKKAQILMQVYYRNAWRQYIRFLGKKVKRFFNKNELPDTLENPIKKGYGAPGIFETIADSFANPADRSLNVYVYHPQNEVAPLQAIFFMNGYLGQAPQDCLMHLRITRLQVTLWAVRCRLMQVQKLYMGTWSTGRLVLPMEVTINPKAYNPDSQYMYTFNNPLNPHVNLDKR